MRQVKEKANWKNMFLLGLEPGPQLSCCIQFLSLPPQWAHCAVAGFCAGAGNGGNTKIVCVSDALQGIQKRALRIILPNLHYDEALILSGLPSLEDRRAAACESFMRNLKPSNPVFGLAMSGRVTTVHSYSLRSCRNYNNKMCKTKRLSEFVSVKYLDFLS